MGSPHVYESSNPWQLSKWDPIKTQLLIPSPSIPFHPADNELIRKMWVEAVANADDSAQHPHDELKIKLRAGSGEKEEFQKHIFGGLVLLQIFIQHGDWRNCRIDSLERQRTSIEKERTRDNRPTFNTILFLPPQIRSATELQSPDSLWR